MQQATKKQMVDFLGEYGRVGGKRLPKRQWAQLPREKLEEILNRNGEIALAFETFLKEDRERADAGQKAAAATIAAPSPEMSARLKEAVDAVAADSTSFLALMQLHQILGELPFGAVPGEELRAACDRLMETAPGEALSLMRFWVEQELAFQTAASSSTPEAAQD